MKRLFLLFALIVFALTVNAQGFTRSAYSEHTLTTDTATNTETLYMNVEYSTGAFDPIKKEWDITLQPHFTNLTGTTAGTAILQAQIDGTWVTLNSGNSDLLAANDTLTVVTTASTLWMLKTKFPKLRMAYVSTGTHTTVFSLSYIFYKPEEQ